MFVKIYMGWCFGLLALFTVVASLGIKPPSLDISTGRQGGMSGSGGTSGFFGGHGSGGFGGSSGYGWGK
jgi:hypothetical protein